MAIKQKPVAARIASSSLRMSAQSRSTESPQRIQPDQSHCNPALVTNNANAAPDALSFLFRCIAARIVINSVTPAGYRQLATFGKRKHRHYSIGDA
jgi:hypothetical protein